MVTVWPQGFRAPKLMDFLNREPVCRPSVSPPGKHRAVEIGSHHLCPPSTRRTLVCLAGAALPGVCGWI